MTTANWNIEDPAERRKETKFFDHYNYNKTLSPDEIRPFEIPSYHKICKIYGLPERTAKEVLIEPEKYGYWARAILPVLQAEGYVDPVWRASPRTRSMDITLCLGNPGPYTEMLKEWDQDIIIPRNGYDEFNYAYKRYMPNQILVFESLVSTAYFIGFPRQLILINCQPQFMFSSIEGKPGDAMLNALRYIAYNHSQAPMRVKLDANYIEYHSLRWLQLRDSCQYY